MRIGTILALLSAAIGAAAPDSPVGPDAVWSPPDGFRERVHAACDARPQAPFPDCFLEQMEKAGASRAALAFAGSTGGQGYLREFRDAGRVDVALAEYPYRANENQVCFFVNGEPPLIDVDDPSAFDRKTLEANPVYGFIAKNRPGVTVFPGDRSGALEPAPRKRPEGGQRFIVTYSLRDGCRACQSLGYARVAFDFDGTGRFLGTQVIQVRARMR